MNIKLLHYVNFAKMPTPTYRKGLYFIATTFIDGIYYDIKWNRFNRKVKSVKTSVLSNSYSYITPASMYNGTFYPSQTITTNGSNYQVPWQQVPMFFNDSNK